eukprot:RCo034819
MELWMEGPEDWYVRSRFWIVMLTRLVICQPLQGRPIGFSVADTYFLCLKNVLQILHRGKNIRVFFFCLFYLCMKLFLPTVRSESPLQFTDSTLQSMFVIFFKKK